MRVKNIVIFIFFIICHQFFLASDKLQILENLSQACLTKDHDTIVDILSQSTKMNDRMRQQALPLLQAAEFNFELPKYKELGSDLLWKQAVHNKHVDMVRLLLDLKAPDDGCDNEGNSLLHRMCHGDEQHLGQVAQLLRGYEIIYSRVKKSGVKQSQRDLEFFNSAVNRWKEYRRNLSDSTSTLLSTKKDIIEELCCRTVADPFYRNKAGQTPLQYTEFLLEEKEKERFALSMLKKEEAQQALLQNKKRSRTPSPLQKFKSQIEVEQSKSEISSEHSSSESSLSDDEYQRLKQRKLLDVSSLNSLSIDVEKTQGFVNQTHINLQELKKRVNVSRFQLERAKETHSQRLIDFQQARLDTVQHELDLFTRTVQGRGY